LDYTEVSRWRNRVEFPVGRAEIIEFLTRKWNKELDYRLIKELWSFNGNRIAVRFAYEWHDDSGQWFRSYGNENWEFSVNGLKSAATHQSMIYILARLSENITGHWGGARIIIPASPSLTFSFRSDARRENKPNF
jgi:nuclear transport factor 2 (NTF2) superfamily protein